MLFRSTSLNVMVSSWPFSMWGIDMIGPITPKASNGHRFIFVIIDYFTKWVEAVSYANVINSVVAHFIEKETIYQYELPKRIISDNGLNLNNDMITKIGTRSYPLPCMLTEPGFEHRRGQLHIRGST